MGSYNEQTKRIQTALLQLAADYIPLETTRITTTDVDNAYSIHESTGEYVTKSTDGFFANKTGAGYRFCALMDKYIQLLKDKSKKTLAEADKLYGEAVWKGFDNPTDPNKRKKKKNFEELRNDCDPFVYNDLLADIYEAASEAYQAAQSSKDEVAKQIFGGILGSASIASVTDAEPYAFDEQTQSNYVDNVKNTFPVLKRHI